MHLFFIDQYISLDMMAPIMFKLSKKNKVFLYNFNKVQTYKHIQLYKFLLKQKNIKISNFTIFDFSKNFIVLLFLKFLLLFPSFILKRGYRYWSYIWKNYNFTSKKKIMEFIKKQNIKTISIDESLSTKKKLFLSEISKQLNIPIIMNHGGLYTVKTLKSNTKNIEKCTFYLSPNKFPILTYNPSKNYFKSGKYNQYGSPRFDLEWLDILKKIAKIDYQKESKKTRVALFVKPAAIFYPITLQLLEDLKKINNIEVKINYKPRDVWPTKISNISKSEIQSSELIIWSDIVLSYASSIILEVICRDKPLIYLNYLQNDTKGGTSWFDDLNFIKKGKNLNNTLKILSNFNKSKKKHVINKKNKEIILKKFISNPKGKGILNKYYFFYNKISKIDFKNV